MKRILTLVFFVLILTTPLDLSAQRYAECDSCGYCKDRKPPENWNTCAQCLYPTLVDKNTLPESNKTLTININPAADDFNKPPKPAAGKYYTQLGCLNTGLNSFRDASAAGGVLNFILTSLIFPAVGTLAFGAIVYGSFLLVTAQGDQFKIQQGKRMITSSMVGILFTFGVVFIVNSIASDILKIPGFDRASTVKVMAAGRCEPIAPSLNKNPKHTVCPNFVTRIRDISDPTKVLNESTFGQISGPESSNPTLSQHRPFTTTAGISFDPTKHTAEVQFIDDLHSAGNYDKNINLSAFEVDNYVCTQVSYQGKTESLSTVLGMNWDTTPALCLQWTLK